MHTMSQIGKASPDAKCMAIDTIATAVINIAARTITDTCPWVIAGSQRAYARTTFALPE
jgi:hypothetical protein